MAGEIAIGGLRSLDANGLGAGRVRREQGSGRTVRPLVNQRKQRFEAVWIAKREEDPASFLAAFEHAGVGEDLQMARHSGLALSHHLRKLTDRELHDSQQSEYPQPRRVGERLKSIS